MERLIHSPRLIFNFKPKEEFMDYMIDKKYYDKLVNTYEYMSNMYFKKLENKYLDDEQLVEIHRWLGTDCYVEYRNFECEYATDIVTLELFENPEDSYQNLLIFQMKEPLEGLYDKLVIGDDYFNNAFILTEDFEWRIFDSGVVDIQKDDMDLEEIGEIKLNKPYDYNIKKVLEGFKEIFLL
jgi:hypothetical protein